MLLPPRPEMQQQRLMSFRPQLRHRRQAISTEQPDLQTAVDPMPGKLCGSLLAGHCLTKAEHWRGRCYKLACTRESSMLTSRAGQRCMRAALRPRAQPERRRPVVKAAWQAVWAAVPSLASSCKWPHLETAIVPYSIRVLIKPTGQGWPPRRMVSHLATRPVARHQRARTRCAAESG